MAFSAAQAPQTSGLGSFLSPWFSVNSHHEADIRIPDAVKQIIDRAWLLGEGKGNQIVKCVKTNSNPELLCHVWWLHLSRKANQEWIWSKGLKAKAKEKEWKADTRISGCWWGLFSSCSWTYKAVPVSSAPVAHISLSNIEQLAPNYPAMCSRIGFEFFSPNSPSMLIWKLILISIWTQT